MKFTFLGTAAAEGFPAVFCNCKYCKEARALGGKNLRTRSQALVNDDLLIDLPADTYHHFLTNGIEGDRIKYLLITHPHSDHLYMDELDMRSGAFAHDMRAPVLQVYCSGGAYKKLTAARPDPKGYEINLVKPFETVRLGEYEVTPLPARHSFGDDAVFYVIKGEKTLLYAHDTGFFYEEVFEYLRREKLRFDFITLDCTNVDIKISDEGTHMGVENIERLMKRLDEIGATDENTVKFINHFSHNAAPFMDTLEKRIEPLGFAVSFDGRIVEL